MTRKLPALGVLLGAVLCSGGCFNFSVKQNVDFPAGRFVEARGRISSLGRHNPDRSGTATKMHILVYDGDSRELVSGAIPMWLAELGIEEGEKKGGRQPEDLVSHYVDFDRRHMKEFARLGPGLLVEVEDMVENSHVLMWLE